MTNKNKTIARIFGIFLLLAAIGGAIVSLANRYLHSHDMASQTSIGALWLSLTVYFFFVCRWVFRRLNALDKDK